MDIMSSTVASSCNAATASAIISVAKRPDNVHAENFAVRFVGYHFDEAVVLAENRGLAVAEEREFPDFHLVARLARGFFRQADGTDLRLAIGRVGNARCVQSAAPACRSFFATAVIPSMRRGVRELRHARDDVADRVKPGSSVSMYGPV